MEGDDRKALIDAARTSEWENEVGGRHGVLVQRGKHMNILGDQPSWCLYWMVTHNRFSEKENPICDYSQSNRMP